MSYEPQSTFKDKLAMDQIVFRQIDRTNLTASYTFESSVIQKLNNLPIISRQWVDDNSERYTDEKQVLVFKSAGPGVTLGYEDDPMVWNDDHSDMGLSSELGFTVIRTEDGDVDWNDKRIVSPRLVTQEVIDYNAMDKIIMEAYEYAELTWPQEITNFERKN